MLLYAPFINGEFGREGFRHEAKQRLHGTFVTQRLLNRFFNQRPIVANPLPKLRSSRQQIAHVSNQISRRSVSSD